MKCALFNLRLGWFCEIATVLSSLFFKQSDGSMEEDDTETLEKKLREKALQSMQRHNKSPEAQPDEDWLVCVKDPLATNKEKHFYLAPKTTHYLEMLWGVGFQMESTQHFFGLILAVTTGWRRSHGAKWRTISALYYLTNLNLSCLEQSATRPCKYYMISQFVFASEDKCNLISFHLISLSLAIMFSWQCNHGNKGRTMRKFMGRAGAGVAGGVQKNICARET